MTNTSNNSILHFRAQEWTGEYFKRIPLKTLGLRIQLGHKGSEQCLLPNKAFNDDLTLIDIGGIHPLALDFCGCEKAQSHVKQLLRAGWFPSTTSDPRTAAMFRVLRQYHVLSFESKASAYEFYHSLARQTDNTGLLKPKVRFLVECVVSQLIRYFCRTDMNLLCVWYGSGDIWRC